MVNRGLFDGFYRTFMYAESLLTLALCILETYIGNNVVWKHHLHLETKNIYWKHALDIGNKNRILETYELDWKHILYIGNITFVWKHTEPGYIEMHGGPFVSHYFPTGLCISI